MWLGVRGQDFWSFVFRMSGFRILCLGFMLLIFGFGVWGLGTRVSIQGFDLQFPNEHATLKARAGIYTLNPISSKPSTLNPVNFKPTWRTRLLSYNCGLERAFAVSKNGPRFDRKFKNMERELLTCSGG